MHEHLLKRGMSVTLVAFTPDPDAVCDMAARTCTSAQCPELSTEKDRYRVLKHAMAAGHASVLEHATFTFLVEGVSRVTEVQLVRHRLASYSVQSGRYCKRKASEFTIPGSIQSAMDAELMNGGGWSPDGCLRDDIDELMSVLDRVDSRMEALGIPAEDRRYLYPQGTRTNITVTMNARELRHFFEERLCTHAQWEIRELAGMMLELVKDVAPVIFENAGPKCVRLGYCPERHGCGRCPPKGDA